MNDRNPNRVNSGKAGAGRYDFKRNSEAEIDLVDAEVLEVPKPRLNSFGLTMLKVAAENYQNIGAPVPDDLADTIRQAEEDIARYEAARKAREGTESIQPEPVPEAEPEVVHDLSTDEGRSQAVKAEEDKMNDLLQKSNDAKAAVNKADANIRDLRKESYRGISFDVERMRDDAQPLRDAAREAHQAYLDQTRVWNEARDYAKANMSDAGLEKIAQRKAALTAVVDSKARLSTLIHNGAPEEDKEAARQEWRSLAAAFQNLRDS
jgi:hypothetical protein